MYLPALPVNKTTQKNIDTLDMTGAYERNKVARDVCAFSGATFLSEETMQ